MKCLKCQANIKVTNTYIIPEGSVHRCVCPDCDTVYTAETLISCTDPKRGEGAMAIAKKRREQDISLNSPSVK